MAESVESSVVARGRVLLVDDEPLVLDAYRRVLQRGGFDVEVMESGLGVGARVDEEDFDVVISDISMPVANGMEVLQAVHERDPHLPVFLMTGRGHLSTAVGALEQGAQRYLLKPIEPAMLCRAAEEGVAIRRHAKQRSAALAVYQERANAPADREALARALDRALATMSMVYQPIMSWSHLRVVAYEGLVRTQEPSLSRPEHLLAAAEALGRLWDVGRAVRRNVAAALRNLSNDLCVYVNLHPGDLYDPDLLSPSAPLSALAARVVLEITERDAAVGFGKPAGYASALRDLGFQLAIDDFGSGCGGLGLLVQLRPDVVKIDTDLVRGIDSDATRRKYVESLAVLCAELGVRLVGVGVETTAERDTLVELGCDFMQGYLFGRPGPLTTSLPIDADPAPPVSRPASRTLPRVMNMRRSAVRVGHTTRVQVSHERNDPTPEPDASLHISLMQEQLDFAPIGVVRLDKAGRITHVNEAWRAFARGSGASEEVVHGLGLDYRFAAAACALGGPAVAAAVAELVAGTRDLLSAVYACHAPHELRWFRIDGKRVAADEAVVLLHTNITDQHVAEARLRAQSIVANALADATPPLETCRRLVRATCEGLDWDHAAIWIADERGRLACADAFSLPGRDGEAFSRGVRARELEGDDSLPHRVWSSRAAEWLEDLRRDAGRPASLPTEVRTGFAVPFRAEGELFAVVEFYGVVRRAWDAALIELLEISGARVSAEAHRALVEQRIARAEAAQQSMRSTLDAIMQCVPAFIMAVDDHGRIRFINREIPPYTMEQVVGSDWLDSLPAHERDASRVRLKRVLEDGASLSFESTAPGADGLPAWFSSQLGPMYQDDRVIGAVLVTYDVTSLKRAQAEYSASQRLAAVGTLAAGVAHEINTPIQFVNDSIHFLRDAANDISGVVEAYKRVARVATHGGSPGAIAAAFDDASEREAHADLAYLADNVPKAFDRCLDGLSRVTTIVRSLKEYAHPSQEQRASVDLNHAIQNTVTIARSEYKYVAELVTDYGPIPPVTCHVNDINQVVLNLIVNAAHAIGDVVRGTDAHGRITLRTRQDGDWVVISISDTGTGIPDAVAPRIFEPFFTTKEVGKGTGQGLALAWAVVKNKHGGELTFETRLGEGTNFHVRLPIHGKGSA